MRKGFLICIMLVSASLGSAQTDSNSITVVASRNTSLQVDQAVFSVAVNSGLNASFEDALGALQGSGITVANFTGVNTATGSFTFNLLNLPPTAILPITTSTPPGLQWSFTLAVPLSKIKDTITTLTTVQQNAAKKNNGLSVTFQVQGSQVSPQALQSQACALTDLIADARAQAQKLADAAGMGVGVILAMSSATSAGSYSIFGAASFPNCTLTVKFALQRF
jgi:hypothetical protein